MRTFKKKLNDNLGHIVIQSKKCHIRETPTLLTDAYSRTDINLKGLHDLLFLFFSFFAVKLNWGESKYYYLLIFLGGGGGK